jgi:hypothetical protein
MTDNYIKSDTDAKSDAVWGAEAISKVLGCTPRRAHHLLSSGELAAAGARMVGHRWLVSRRKLLAFIAGEMADA